MSAARELRQELTAKAALRPTAELCAELEQLEARHERDDTERLNRSVLIGALCRKHPEASRAFDAWVDSDNGDVRNVVPAITAAARAATP